MFILMTCIVSLSRITMQKYYAENTLYSFIALVFMTQKSGMLSLDVLLGSSAKCLSILQPLDLRGWTSISAAHQLDAVIQQNTHLTR